ncbi:MAG: HAMP domain-containing protein [Planctomycetes bacterium]|nr:HAMP domain-containing protein [Planctomycetota bacterium]
MDDRATTDTPTRPVASIRRSILLWTGVLLLGVIVSFGALLYGRTVDALYSEIDASLEDRGAAIAGAIEWEEEDGWELDLSDDYLRGVAEVMGYEVTLPDGTILASGGMVPAVGDDAAGRALGFRSGADFHELRRAGPAGTLVRVARSIIEVRDEASMLLTVIVLGGVAILVLALLGSWWLSGRVLAPIARISQTAHDLSARDLSGRIDLATVPSELHDLARSLNDAFDRLEQAFVRQTRFTADASHELRTPLSVIRAQAESVLRPSPGSTERDAGEYRDALSSCLRAANRMTGVVEGLLSLARLDAGDVQLEATPVALEQVVREAVELARPAALDANVTVEMSLDAVRVAGDPHLLGEVASNLIDNAIRYNRSGGQVSVALVAINGVAELRVEDDGVGIPEASIPHLFDRFFRVDPARSRKQGGSGLGLSIAQWIVEAHRGSIAARSEEGRGSAFTVTLPVDRS